MAPWIALFFLLFAPPVPEVEVATIKLNAGPPSQGGMRLNPGRLSVINTLMRTLIRNAYQVPDYTISGGPGWINSDRYDIEAKVEGELKGDNALLVLRFLLEDRFQLRVHRETKEGPIYSLAVAASGLKLQPSNCVVVDPAHRPPPLAPDEKRPENCGLNKGGVNGPVRTLNVTGLKMDETDMAAAGIPGLTFYLSSILGRAVVDKTGLAGRFDIHLEYTPAELVPGADNPAPSIFTAVQEQLGLKLESSRGPVEVLVIDRVERPSEN
jgi:uncharacterized protein (TIGR03435 family)